MLSDPLALFGAAALFGIAFVAIPRLLRGITRLRPGLSAHDRDQSIAQIRAFTARSAEDGEAEWDGAVRGTPPNMDL